MTAYRPIKIPGRPGRFRMAGGLVFLFLILAGLSQTSFRHLASNASLKILSPFWTVGRGGEIVFTQLGGLFTSKLKLASENARLRTIIDEQAAALLNQDSLKQENIALRQIVNRTSDPLPLTVGRLVSRGQQFPLGLAVIDLGSQNTNRLLVPGMVVSGGGSTVLGELTEIYKTNAQMRLYSTAGQRLLGNLGGTHAPIELTGRGAGNFIASLPRDLPVAVNDRVTMVVAGHEFLLAAVNDIRRAAGDSFQEIFLRSPVNLSQLTWVEIYAP